MADSQLDELIERLLDDELSPAEVDELVGLLRDHPHKIEDLRSHLEIADLLSQYEDPYRDLDRFKAALQTRQDAAADRDGFVNRVVASAKNASASDDRLLCDTNEAQIGMPQASGARNSVARVPALVAWTGWLAAATAILLLAGVLLHEETTTVEISERPNFVSPTEADDPDDLGVAVLTQASQLVGKEVADLIPGQTIPPGTIAWESGLIQLEFYGGATVVAQGPAKLEILDGSRVVCHSGRLRANVPEPARGFAVLAPTLELVDLGTEFGVDVSANGQTEVHVFDGTVEIYEPQSNRNLSTRRELNAGDAVAVGQGGERLPIDVRNQDFVTPGRLHELTNARNREQQRDWQEFRDSLRSDPRVVAYFPFDRSPTEDRTLDGYGSDGSRLVGAIVGCEWSEGRWPDKAALQFKRPGDRVRIQLPGEYDSLTYSTWLRVDGLDRRFNSLLLTDGFPVNAPHWQIRQDGRLILGVSHSPKASRDYMTEPVFDVFRLGQWVHLATVYDASERRIDHYVNGELHARTSLHEKAEGKLRIGDATIGNWYRGSNRFHPTKVRNLNGCMDELIVFGDVLGEAEIQKIYDVGKP
ncbi:LamG-like jellyroll fold domain-containing protein [Roseiconus lacunae]|uniref:LamG-like jellyroll fold domain-containing protein n=1 Tax=Roseiconus lacunae TaxID=2605694 RepID=UPI00308F90E4|nr:LamG-like jellyroll fold domain-containing protein [Stieleria sp. HD01]